MNNNSETLSEELLFNTSEIINENEEVLIKNGGTFNIFSILDKERKEVDVHSAFIFELINPNGSHKQKDLYLRAFVKDVLQINDFDFKTASVYKEKYAGQYGRIDLFIENKNYKIAIEVKIGAPDGKIQIQKYFEYLQETKTSVQQFKIYYLTLYGSEPSEMSYGKLKDEERKIVVLKSFSENILQWLLQCTSQIKIDKVNQATFQYIDIIKKITGNPNEKLEGILNKLILKDVDTYKAALRISEAVKDARQEILDGFISALKTKIKNSEFLQEVIEDSNFANYYNLPKNRYAYLTYLLKETQYEGISIYFRIELEWRLYFSFYIAKKNKGGSINWDAKISNDKRSLIKSEYFNDVNDLLNSKSDTNCLGWDYLRTKSQDDYNFFEAAGEYNVEYLADKEIMEEETEQLAKVINEIIETVLITRR